MSVHHHLSNPRFQMGCPKLADLIVHGLSSEGFEVPFIKMKRKKFLRLVRIHQKHSKYQLRGETLEAFSLN